MPEPKVTVVVPTLAADAALEDCLRALEAQTFRDFVVVIVDNSGRGAVSHAGVRVFSNRENVGFGEAINQAVRSTTSEFVAALNDDAAPHPRWLEALLAATGDGGVGSWASQVRLAGTDLVDSAGMLLARDCTGKQRGHREPVGNRPKDEDVLFASGSAALYRRAMLEQIGGFPGYFFLYCEDTDVGLRAQRCGWRCRYVAGAVVDHRYSHSAGRVSPLKAYYVERNRLFTAVRNLPLAALLLVPFAAVVRYSWHLVHALRGRGAASHLSRQSGMLSLVAVVLRAHAATLARLPQLLRERREIARTARLSGREMSGLLARHRITLREVAAQ